MTKAELDTLRAQVRMLAMQIGLTSAARAMGLSETRVRNWSSRQKWLIRDTPALCRIPASDAIATRSDTTAVEALQKVVQHYGDRAKIGATIAGAKVFEALADKTPGQLIGPATAIAADQWAKVTDKAAGWTAERQRGATVNVAVINPPSQAKVEEMKLADAKLDEFTKLLMQPDQEG